MTDQPDWEALHAELLPKLAEARRVLSAYPGVVGVDLGVKETGGDLMPSLAFRVYVESKLPVGELDPAARIPDSVLDVPTDVIEMSQAVQHSGTVQGGGKASTGGCLSSYGTLACIAQRDGDSKIVVLSNQHIFEQIGEKVGQPGCVCLCCACGKVADVTAVQNDGSVDCGIALLRDGVSATNTIAGLNADGTDGTLQGSRSVSPGTQVVKVGVTTGRTTGTVVSITFPTAASSDEPAKTNQLLIKPDPAFPRFDDHGDSGSAIVTTGNVVVGLGWGGFDTGAMNGQTVACPIDAVTTAMHISIINGALAHSAVPRIATPGGELALEDAYDELRRLAAATPAGRELIDVVTAQHHEVIELVNHNRPVTVAWHRGRGPAWLAALVRSARVGSYILPDSIEGVTRAEFIAALRAALDDAGSPALRGALAQHGDALAGCLLRARTTRELVESYSGLFVA